MKKPKQFKPKRSKVNKFSLNSNKSPTGRAKGYTALWQKYRYRFLHYNPLCYACGREANTVDHIVAHKGNDELFWSETNYIPMCHSCHSIVTGRFDKFAEPKTEDKMRWLIKQRDLCGVEIKVKVVPFGRLRRDISRVGGTIA